MAMKRRLISCAMGLVRFRSRDLRLMSPPFPQFLRSPRSAPQPTPTTLAVILYPLEYGAATHRAVPTTGRVVYNLTAGCSFYCVPQLLDKSEPMLAVAARVDAN